MTRFLAGFTFAVVLLGLGWSVGRAQEVTLRKKTMQDDGVTTCHKYDPAKLQLVENKRETGVGEISTWTILTDYGLGVGSLATKREADAALAAAKQFTTMCLIGRGQNEFKYFKP